MSSASPSGQPSAKEKRYDRQLRLWGANGQNRLEAAHLALFTASATGCEILKNLVLPGVGQFTIIDNKIVEEADLGTNFFLDEDSIGKPRAERATSLLAELNPDVKGHFIQDNLSNILEHRPELLHDFTHIIIVSPFTSNLLRLLPIEIPTFIINSIGFKTSLRIAQPTHNIVETHPDSLIDLRLLNPWPELTELAAERCQTLDLAESEGGMTDYEHGHVPYVLLLLKYLEDWKASHNGNPPSTYKEKKEFGLFVQSKGRPNVPGGSEENYDEAAAAVLKNVREAELSSETRAIFADRRCVDPPSDADNFWILAHAVSEFMSRTDQGAGLLPLSGSFPDMKAESETYVGLQSIYRARAQRDASLVHTNVQGLLTKLGRDPDSIPSEEVSQFAKHANFLRSLDYRPLSAEYTPTPDEHHKSAVCTALNSWDVDDSLIHDYIALRACQEFFDRHQKPAGAEDGDVEHDEEAVVGMVRGYMKSLGHEGGIGDRTMNCVKELVRAGGSELHVMAALVGGVAAQEVTKVITKQYVPINNTVVFDGIQSRSTAFEF